MMMMMMMRIRRQLLRLHRRDLAKLDLYKWPWKPLSFLLPDDWRETWLPLVQTCRLDECCKTERTVSVKKVGVDLQ